MASDEGLLINISTSPLPRPHRRPPAGQRPPNPQWGRGKKAMKRTLEGAQEASPVKKQRASLVPQAKKPWKKTKRHNKGTGPPRSSPEKLSSETREDDFNKRPFVKTSSLFKNNPEIPDIQRTAVKQVQEEIFTSDSFDQLDLHPHLTSTITSSLKLSSMTR
ncbi:PREDICTED: probable ATP-dependent RNA helicase DDX31 [Thamnophis sirtalis]|uniref:Probable ATP-dependent RNA helicase DDX31 n=1 Tax=Thamnophis sirtalis TaxID=35019 RepID=A0A6I9YGC6_9SAUR|nr:PREDICTED: probable ATP-dependent RNA helicase DDX31 [Thamnophis sirtalis]